MFTMFSFPNTEYLNKMLFHRIRKIISIKLTHGARSRTYGEDRSGISGRYGIRDCSVRSYVRVSCNHSLDRVPRAFILVERGCVGIRGKTGSRLKV